MLFLLPFHAYAAMVINEIAWMGTTVSGTNEWIELYNDSDTAVDLSGWSIVSRDGSPNIALQGIVAARGYFLIERTDDDTVPGIPADLVISFGSGLSNSGETLDLKNALGGVVDSVEGGKDWSLVGGDNVTKDTAQRGGNGWATQPGTPRAKNVVGNSESTSTISTTGSSQTASSSSPAITPTSPASPAKYPRAHLTINAGEDRTVFRAVQSTFSASALGLYDEALPYASYVWNFGDGSVASGRSVAHTYRQEGEYVVSLEVTHLTIKEKVRFIVTVISPKIAINEVVDGEDGYVKLINHSSEEVDLSYWVISGGDLSYVLPYNTIIRGGKYLLLPRSVIGISMSPSDTITLRFSNGVVVCQREGSRSALSAPEKPIGVPNIAAPAPLSLNENQPAQRTQKSISKVEPRISEPAIEVLATEKEASVYKAYEATSSDQTAVIWQSGNNDSSSSPTWVLGLAAAVLVAFAGYLLTRSQQQADQASEYAILEDIIEHEEIT